MTIAIRAEGLSKSYVIGHQHAGSYATLRDEISQRASALARRMMHPFSGRGADANATEYEEFWALRDVSFDISAGERVGIVGRNGAGKSTLLKLLSRITEPSSGTVTISGRVASLLEVGTGFHPELSGRENIYLNGAVLGMSKAEIRRKFDEIVDFAEIEKFLDTPVKRYSSGMYVRLAFAVAAHLEPEIMIVDEVLAVGDVKFQRKCLGKMEDIGKQGRTVLFVSHNMQTVRQLCDRAIFLSAGQVVADGPSREVVNTYLDEGAPASFESYEDVQRYLATLPADPAMRVIGVGVFQSGEFSTRIENGKPAEVVIEYEVLRETLGLHVCFRLLDTEGTMLIESINCGEDEEIPDSKPGRFRAVATIPANFLAASKYEVLFIAAINNVRQCMPEEVRISISVDHTGRVNQAFPGYVSSSKLWPIISWERSMLC